MTDHSVDINLLRHSALRETNKIRRLLMLTAADLLEIHDVTGISLDDWESARALCEELIGHEITENEC